MFLHFMRIARYLNKKDAIFYLAFTNIILRRYEKYSDFDAAYEEFDSMSNKQHSNSMLLKSVLDVYYFPKKRHIAITTIINIEIGSTRIQISRMIRIFKILTREIYPNELFDPNISSSNIQQVQY